MREQIEKLNAEYGFNLTDAEIDLIVRQAARADELLQQLRVLDFPEVAPLMKIDRQESHDRK